MRDTLHWLLVTLRISYRIDVLVCGAFLVAPLRTCCNFPAFEPFAFLLLASYWHFVLLLQLGSVTHSPLLAFSPIMESRYNSTSYSKIMKVRCAGCLTFAVTI